MQRLRPEVALLNFAVSQLAYQHQGHGRLADDIWLDRTQGNPSPDEVARLEAAHEARRAAWAVDPAFVSAVGRLQGAGVDWAFDYESDVSGEFSLLRLRIAADDLGALEALAAEDSGYVTPEARASAAECFRIFVLRDYHPDWRRNRGLYPDVGGSPYAASASRRTETRS
ncbi:hypothetical protein FZC33_14425 [Labrys sp. KNU-23]|uniref:hypothetical protein n=1 Tax=Labrys sp. KNU-23 TaxID=2789216 RepID=UPI0011EF9A1D|nr:hypothetical protein [Labrys sp. KNU-23]QEN87449.1 hypothetical protein FZC33_14425 [Labrys sp. KNU-23]